MSEDRKADIKVITLLDILIIIACLICIHVCYQVYFKDNKEVITSSIDTFDNAVLEMPEEALETLKAIDISRSTSIIVKEETIIPTPTPTPISTEPPKILTSEEQYDIYIEEISEAYGVNSNLIKSMVWHESRYLENAVNWNGECVGLMQVSTRWNKDRAIKLGVSDFFDPYSNILLGVDCISEFLNTYDDPAFALMMYNMKHDDAKAMYARGEINTYARSVLERADQLENGGA